MLHYELGQLSNHFTRSVVVQEPGRTAHRLVDTGYDWLFVKLGLLDCIARPPRAQPVRPARAPGRQGTSATTSARSTSGRESYLIAAAFTTLVFLVRLLVLCSRCR
jgi:hypothetical protein